MSADITNLVNYSLYIMTEIQESDVRDSRAVKIRCHQAMHFTYSRRSLQVLLT